MHFVSALAGVVNRLSPQLYLLFTPSTDVQWLQYMQQQPGGFLANTTINTIASLDVLVRTFRSSFQGAVVYDPAIPALSLVASTAAGAEDLLPVCYRSGNTTNPSIYDQFVASGVLPVARFLNSSMFSGNITGSRKGDAYTWAIQEFIVSNKSDASNMGYYIDYYWVQAPACCGDSTTDKLMSTLANHDWFISRRGFFWDLSVWDDEKPVDDPTQPLGTDLKVLLEVARAAYEQVGESMVIHVGGFTPWAYKYVTPYGKHQGVETEWQTMRVLSCFNIYVDADACCIGAMANAAFYTHYPLPERFPPAPFPTEDSLRAKGAIAADGSVVPHAYYFWYAGDYDSASWLYSQLLSRWNDGARGAVPIGWAVDPNLALRFPLIYPLLHATATANDTFIAGDSGAGYLNPTQLYPPREFSGLPSGVGAWQQHNVKWFTQFGLSFTGFIVNGVKPLTEESETDYAIFSPHGITGQYDSSTPSTELREGSMPVFHEAADIVNVDAPTAAGMMCSFDHATTGTTASSQSVTSSANKKLSNSSSSNTASHLPLNATGTDKTQTGPHFMMFRSILAGAAFMRDASTQAQQRCPNLRVVSPLEIAALARVALGGNNNFIAAYLSDTFPRRVASASVVAASFSIRNDGWNTLTASCIQLEVNVGPTSSTRLKLAGNATPGSLFVVSGNIQAPSATGPATLQYGLVSTCGEKMQSSPYRVDVVVV